MAAGCHCVATRVPYPPANFTHICMHAWCCDRMASQYRAMCKQAAEHLPSAPQLLGTREAPGLAWRPGEGRVVPRACWEAMPAQLDAGTDQKAVIKSQETAGLCRGRGPAAHVALSRTLHAPRLHAAATATSGGRRVALPSAAYRRDICWR